ncbi:recombinase family protein [Cerasicoccus maritimus]|uniref:recombinase family protein n=1 Tax=Cerasicoccus maritimus TaxID=490089 RepID=UPI002852ABA8|nr:recombinase family protein [Cerasicoccus maritimus]
MNAANDIIPVAIYTRKSTDAHIEREVHSLSVQQASAESFIESQKHRGWRCLEEHFDDNNVSGGTLERPALNRLMERIREGKVKVVVINRLDRISRSLVQFLELTEFFETHGASIVSVTQNFNTGDSIGKLLLHILISFAEFERALIRERVTERMHAARRQGRFVGGRPVLGYSIKPGGGELIVDDLEAVRVCDMFALYLELASLKATVRECKQRGWKNKKWVTRQGKVMGGNDFSVNGLHKLLTNRLYLGEIAFQGEVFPGKHEAIVDSELFDAVQAQLASTSLTEESRKRNRHAASLKGLLHCTACHAPFVHTYTQKQGRQYRYYTCRHKRDEGPHACPSPSLPAGEIESLVAQQLLAVGCDAELQDLVYQQLTEAAQQDQEKRQKQEKAARQQLRRIREELKQSEELEAPLPMVRHLQAQEREIVALLQSFDEPEPLPSKETIVAMLRDLQSLWPSFNAQERCDFTQALIRQVEFDAEGGKVTLHFSDAGLVRGLEMEAAS